MNSPAEGRFAAQEARAERRYRALIEGSREPVGLFGPSGELVYANPALQRMLWGEPTLIELAHPADREAVAAQYAGLASRPQGRLALRAHFRQHDGSWRMLEAALHNRLQDPDVNAVVASFADIGREVDLEQRFRATFDHAAVGIAHVAEDGRFQLVNRKLCQILGYAREELSALTVFDVSHPEDRDVTLALRRKMRAHELDFFSVIKRYLRKDGAAVWAEVTVSLVRAPDGAPRYEIAVFEDISARRQAEEALSRSERRFRALIENSADGILLTDAEGRMMYASPGMGRTLGYAKGETLGWQLRELVHPQDRAELERSPVLRARLRHKDGRYRLLEGTRTDLTADESVRAVVYNFRDVTEREEALARARRVSLMYAALSAANEVSAQLTDERELYRRICEIAVQLGGMRLASTRMLEPGSDWLETCGSAGEAALYVAGARISVDPGLAEGRGLAGTAMRENRTTVCNDFVAEPSLAPWHEGARRFGFGAVICAPLRRGGAPVGLLLLYSAETHYFDAELVTLIERMAANVGHALERLDGERRLRESEARFRSLADLSSDWYWEQDEELRFTWASPGAEDRGAPVSATLGLRRWEIREYTPVCGSWAEHRALLEARKPFRDFEYVRQDADGARRYIAIDGEPMFHDDGRFKGYRGTARDITARKLAELGMERLKTLYAALSAANEAILRAKSGEELLARVCEIAVAAGSFILGTAFMFDRESGLLRRVAASGSATASPLGDTVPEESMVNLAFRRREVLISNDYACDPRTAARRRAPLPFPMGSAGTWPLTVDGEAVGVFSLVHAEKDAFSDEMNVLLQGLADNMSFALANFAHEERRRRAEERFHIVARATNDVVWDWDLMSGEVWWNDNFCAVFAYDASEVGSGIESWTARIHPEDAGRIKQDIREAIERGDGVWTGEYRFRRGDGSYAHVFDRGLPLRDANGRAVRMIGAMVDITERKRAERKLALHAQRQEIIARLGQFALGGADLDQVLAEAARVLRAGGCDVAAIIERVGESGYEFLVRAAHGQGAEASIGKSHVLEREAAWSTLIDSTGAVVHDRSYFETRHTDRPWSAWLRRLGSGVYVPIRAESAAFGILLMGSLRDAAFDADDLSFAEAIAHVLSTAVRRHHTQTRLAYLAEFDTLTGLPNRNLLQERLAQSIAQARRRHWHGALLFIDLDRFKLINDTLGHHVGDRLIAEVGQRIKQCVRGGDTVGRVSGDEFGVVLTDLAKADDAAIVAQKVLDGLARPFELGGNEAYVTASIGITVFPADGVDAHTLLKNADMAMYRAKELSRNAYCFFTAEMNQRSVARLHLNTDLRRAIDRGEFALHYQPKLRLSDGALEGVEALLRWNHPSRGVVPPADFIPALEDSGLILPVGEWVLGEAARQLAAWQRAGLRAVPIAVNLSAKQFRRRDLDALIGAVLAAHAVPAELIELEITESCLMEEPEEAVRLLASLRAAGLKISVDDFGTGYSSLSYLTRLPLTALKIDRSFVRDAATSGEAASIVRAVIDMAHNLGFTVIAEGVETAEQVAFLQRHGCDLGQGYLFGRPVPAAELAVRLARAA